MISVAGLAALLLSCMISALHAQNFRDGLSAQLLDELAKAKGGETIVLADGNYGALHIVDRAFPAYVTLKSANTHGAVFDSIIIDNSRFVRIDGVHVSNSSNGAASSAVVAVVGGSSDVEIINSEINGLVDSDYNGFHGLYSNGRAKRITFANNYVHDVKNGGTFIDTTDLKVIGNKIDYIGNDSFKFLSVTDVKIENNIGATNLFPSENAHLDFIQFQGGDSSDVVIRGNIFLPSTRADVQGIFLADAHYSNVLIEQNIIVTGMIRGISVTSGTDVVAKNNTVLHVKGRGSKATFIIVDGKSYGNIQSSYIGHSGLGLMDGNLNIQSTDPNSEWHYGRYFANADRGLGITISDLAPVSGSAVENFGAYDRLVEALAHSLGDAKGPRITP
ncbi:right-handed parallel beta-helix repeat-containing protein [Roseivivax lentus]|uniref:right-handed parallel beta-helix repeat-containing protein n=1 Tax=Roseivivax lentus TaxID=633194 RepID=UPI00097083E6|nr:right-handed parallel beta-helix repeat-containing protein [Roseivivax lentus]